MRINLKKLKQLSVETKSGTNLGKIADIIFDIDSHTALQYIIKPSFISAREYTIAKDQVLSINEEKMIVEDNTISQEKKEKETKKTLSPNPAMMRE